MLRSLRNRLILSHALPLLLIVPLMGIVLIYAIETRYLIPNLVRNLEGDARLIADLAASAPGAWSEPGQAQEMLEQLDPGQDEHIMLVSPDGALLGSTDPADLSANTQPLTFPGYQAALQGQVTSSLQEGSAFRDDTVDVAAPVKDGAGRVIGIVRLTAHYASIYEEFLRLRSLIGAILLVSLVLGVGLGLALALNIEAPVQQVTEAVYDLASGQRQGPLPERGPEEVRRLQRAANHLVERLQALEESRQKLLSNLVHELGRPLGALRAAIQALRRGAKADPRLLDELLEGMDEEALRLQRLTEELAHLHDQVLGGLELEREPFPLGEWLARQLPAWQAAAQEKGLDWAVSIPGDLPVTSIDPHRMGQAVGNLISNAIKYTPEGGRVAVQAGTGQGEVWIRVADSGPGIPPEEQERVFLPFYRGGQGRRFPQGMGLGLSITRDVVSAHGGRIVLESEPGQGSQFTIRLPDGEKKFNHG